MMIRQEGNLVSIEIKKRDSAVTTYQKHEGKTFKS